MVSAGLSPIAVATPPPVSQRSMWDDCFAARYGAIPGSRRVWDGSGVDARHAVVDPRVEDVSAMSTGARMDRYVCEALPLATRAVADAISAADLAPADIDLLAVVSCTGYATPGLDTLVALELGLPTDLQRVCIGHMGCHAALPGLATVSDAVVARGMRAVLVAIELTSLHIQPASRDTDQLVSHALFSDAAAAVAVTPAGAGLQVVDVAARTDATHRRAMTWLVTDLGFRMHLSSRVPAALAVALRPTIDDLLHRNGLDVGAIAGWAIHPGGPRILDVCADELGLDDRVMAASRDTLRDHGNCSSATVLLVLQRLLATQPLRDGDHVVALAFGPGLTLHAVLLRWG